MLLNKLSSDVDNVYFEPDFLVMMESHLTELRQSDQIGYVAVNEHQNYKYEGDLYGLLDELNIEKKFHFIVARINQYDHSGDFKGDVATLILPDFNYIELLKSVYQTRHQF